MIKWHQCTYYKMCATFSSLDPTQNLKFRITKFLIDSNQSCLFIFWGSLIFVVFSSFDWLKAISIKFVSKSHHILYYTRAALIFSILRAASYNRWIMQRRFFENLILRRTSVKWHPRSFMSDPVKDTFRYGRNTQFWMPQLKGWGAFFIKYLFRHDR